MKTKVIAMYLPQYHEIEENSLFWGKGYTDWVGVKKATPFLENQVQPRVPLDNNYYDLSKVEPLRWQAKIAKEHGIYGFGIYHYWFNTEKNLLTKPAENLLANKDIELPFFFAWDNTNWKRTWSKIPGNAWSPLVDENNKPKLDNGKEILIEYILGDKPEWKMHFDYLLPYFKDERYIKIDGKPLFFIFHYSEKLIEMIDYWDELAKENGFNGVHVALSNKTKAYFDKKVKYLFNYEPLYETSGHGNFWHYLAIKLGLPAKNKKIYTYDWVWKNTLKNAKKGKRAYSGCIVTYDDTPRRGKNATVITGSTPEKFEKYLSKLLDISSKKGKEYVFLTAWNEWGEGAYLEPDETYGYQYLEAAERAIKSKDE